MVGTRVQVFFENLVVTQGYMFSYILARWCGCWEISLTILVTLVIDWHEACGDIKLFIRRKGRLDSYRDHRVSG
jgi:hypothetical protein